MIQSYNPLHHGGIDDGLRRFRGTARIVLADMQFQEKAVKKMDRAWVDDRHLVGRVGYWKAAEIEHPTEPFIKTPP